jgi:hypothetical protein
MTDKLTLYNNALAHLGERRLASLSESREPRRVLDDIYADVTKFCLERKFWNFGYRTVEIDASTTMTPGFGYLYAFTIPDDWIRTRRLSGNPTLDPPLTQVSEEAGYWYTNLTPLFVQYNSSDPLYGMNLGAWPQSFADYVELRLASKGCRRITGSDEQLKGGEGLLKREEKAYKIANANCAMNEAIGFAPTSSWVRARRGFMPGMPGAGGDDPTGGSLIP